MANDTAPLLSSKQATARYGAANEDISRASSPTDIEGDSRKVQEEATEQDDPVPTVNLYLVIPLLLIGMASTVLVTGVQGAAFHPLKLTTNRGFPRERGYFTCHSDCP